MNTFRGTNYACDASGAIINIKTGRAIKQSVTRSGYAKVCIYHLGKRSFHYAHRVVAECMVENKSGKPEVNHIDGDKLNNNPKNLEWVTSSENQHHAFRCGLQKPTILVGYLNGRYKGEIRYMPVSGGDEKVIRSLTDCCKHGFHGPSVHKVISGQLKPTKDTFFGGMNDG